MNGPNPMYRLKPVLKLNEEIDLPDIMYQMKNVQQSHNSCMEEKTDKTFKTQAANITEQVKKLLKVPMPEMAALEKRQLAILEQLVELKKQMSALRSELQVPAVSPVKQEVTSVDPLLQNEFRDVVVIASPKYPPYFLQALQQLWSGSLNLGIQCHIHSSLPNVSNDLLATFNSGHTNSQGTMLNILLLWKDVGPYTKLHVSPTKNSIVGEVNILRYLSRLGPPKYNYELIGDPTFAAKLDEILDTCYTMVHSRTAKERQSLIRYMNKQLGKSQFLAGDKMTIADVAAWSVFRQLRLPISDFTKSMNNWLDRCSSIYRLGR